MSMRRRWIPLLVALLTFALHSGALASWLALGVGSGGAQADSIPKPSAPSASVSGRNVTVTWTAVKFAKGTNVSGYTVARYGADGSAQTIKTNCQGTITTLTCTERAVPSGSWTYAVKGLQGAWSGSESDKSTAVTVGSPSMSITSGTPVNSLPATLGGSLSNFVTGQTVTFRLDSQGGSTLTGSISPNPIPENGSSTFSVTIPAGTSQGAHTLFAVGSSGDVASASFSVASGPTPTSLRINDGGGGSRLDGRPDGGDDVVITFSQAMSVSTFCSTWSGDSTDQSITTNSAVSVVIQNNAAATGNDRLVVTVTGTPCGGNFRFGSVDLGSPDFVINGNVTFQGSTGSTRSTIAWTATTRTLRILLGSPQAADVANIVATGEQDAVEATYFPDSNLKNTSNQGISGTVKSPNEKQF